MNIEMIRISICPRSEPQMFIFSINVCLTGIALAKLLPSVCVCVCTCNGSLHLFILSVLSL